MGGGYFGPVVNADLFWQNNNPLIQANQAGGVDREAGDAFGFNLRPGLRHRWGVSDTCNGFIDARFLLAYIDAPLTQVAYDPTKIQSPVQNFKRSCTRIGAEAGFGFEKQLGNIILRPGVAVQMLRSNHVNGIGRQETQIMTTLECVRLIR